MLVDTGTGPPWAPAATWFPKPGGLLEGLGAEGVSPTDVTDVILTHLHADHVGWSVHGDAAAPLPTFAMANLPPGLYEGVFSDETLRPTAIEDVAVP